MKTFLNNLAPEIEQLYIESKSTNDISLITKFAKALQKLSLEHNITHMVGYSALLLEKIDEFNIDSIMKLLEEYQQTLKNLNKLTI